MNPPQNASRTAGAVNLANGLTVARIVGAPALFWAILTNDETAGTSWIGFAFGWTLGATDYFDGILARRGRVSRWGAFLDPLADKIVVLGAMACLVSVERYAWLPVVIIAVREFGITAVRSYFARFGLAMPARRSAKYKTLVQGLAISIAIAPPLEDTDVVVTVALWVAVAFTVVTGLQYARDGRATLSHTGSLPTVGAES